MSSHGLPEIVTRPGPAKVQAKWANQRQVARWKNLPEAFGPIRLLGSCLPAAIQKGYLPRGGVVKDMA